MAAVGVEAAEVEVEEVVEEAGAAEAALRSRRHHPNCHHRRRHRRPAAAVQLRETGRGTQVPLQRGCAFCFPNQAPDGPYG